MWLTVRCREFSFLLTVLQILLIFSPSSSSESKVISSHFLRRLDTNDAFQKCISLCVFELKITWHFPGLACIWFFLHKSKKIFSNFLKLRIYRWYILCTGIGNNVIIVASNVIILAFKKEVNQINIKQQPPKHCGIGDTVVNFTFLL